MRSSVGVAAIAVVLGVILAPGSSAHADSAVHAGLNLRAGPGAHPFRGIIGVDFGETDVSLTLDPMVVFDDQFDADLMTTTKLTDAGWSVLFGWRTTAIGILGGNQFQEKVVIGVGSPLPRFCDLPIRTRWALEAAAVIVKHGAGLPTDFISFGQGRDFIDLINFGMFFTVELTSADR